MPALLNLLFLLVVCAVLYGIFLVVWVGVLFLCRAQHKFWYSLLSLPMFLVLLVGFFIYQTRPATVFEHSFGFVPTADVSSIKSYQWVLGDSGVVYLRFKASPVTIQRIVARGLTPLGTGMDGPSSTNNDPPTWWQPPATSTRGYVGTFNGRGFGFEEEYLIYDPKTQDTFFRFLGID